MGIGRGAVDAVDAELCGFALWGGRTRLRKPLHTETAGNRYACSGAPSNANLYNQAGLPASPFCSDLKLLPWERSDLN